MRQLIFAIAVIGLASPSMAQIAVRSPPPEADYGAFPADHEQIVRDYFELELVDPESVRYRLITAPVPVLWDNHWDGFGYMVCVTFNARNRMGGYDGWSSRYLIIRDGQVRDWTGTYPEAQCPANNPPDQ